MNSYLQETLERRVPNSHEIQRAHEVRYFISPGQTIKVNAHLFPTSFYNDTVPKGKIIPLFMAIDRSSEQGEESMNPLTGSYEKYLKDHPVTPYEQAFALDSTLSYMGVTVLESLQGIDPQVIIEVEKLLIPEADFTLHQFQEWLANEVPSRVEATNFTKAMKDVINGTRIEILGGVKKTIQYQSSVINRYEKEVTEAINTGFGRLMPDTNEVAFYANLGREIPAELSAETLRGQKAAAAKNETTLATAIEGIQQLIQLQMTGNPNVPVTVDDSKVKELEARLEVQNKQINELIEAQKLFLANLKPEQTVQITAPTTDVVTEQVPQAAQPKQRR